MDIPSKVKAGMQRNDQKSQKPEIHVRARPALERAETGEVPPLPDAQEHEHQDRQQPDPSVCQPPDRTPGGNGGAGVIEITEEECNRSDCCGLQIALYLVV